MDLKQLRQFQETLLENQHSGQKCSHNVLYNENEKTEKYLEVLYRIEAKLDVLLMQQQKNVHKDNIF
ncbi:hypothetical protein [Heyndrickxia acidicola]|uniref:Uncharacterized protein n=1 Tax=Heyndrickxia acidicola TaxID=209389 RepID=A0ABU6MM89_9BACI|nr:hypothetical protein [Heyndrickxia acidicola]MED1204332.1 hypothetical protein [Heyndrickxia acidicola]